MHGRAVESEAGSGGREQEVCASKATGEGLSLRHPGLLQQGQGWGRILFEKARQVGWVQGRGLIHHILPEPRTVPGTQFMG